MRRAVLTVILLASAYVLLTWVGGSRLSAPRPIVVTGDQPSATVPGTGGGDRPSAIGPGSGGGQSVEDAFQNHASDVPVEGEGVVIKRLADDLEGGRHQRFLLRLASGQTLLVAHNTDIAPRIDDLGEGDRVQFSGEYIWNNKGGLVHWTHRDPARRHGAGWLKHRGQVYQ